MDIQKVMVRGTPLWMDMDDQVLAQHYAVHGTYEELEIQLLKKSLKPGMRFIDIGAYVGDHTVFMAQCVGPNGNGIAIEAAPANFSLLKKNLIENKIYNVRALHAAAMDFMGEIDMYLSSKNHGDHRVFDANDEAFFKEKKREKVKVPCLPIDELHFNPHIVKIDVQGAEMHVFDGMKRILSSNIILFCEFWPYGMRKFNRNPADMLDLLTDYGFTLVEINEETKELKPVDKIEILARYPELGFTNFCCFKENF